MSIIATRLSLCVTKLLERASELSLLHSVFLPCESSNLWRRSADKDLDFVVERWGCDVLLDHILGDISGQS